MLCWAPAQRGFRAHVGNQQIPNNWNTGSLVERCESFHQSRYGWKEVRLGLGLEGKLRL